MGAASLDRPRRISPSASCDGGAGTEARAAPYLRLLLLSLFIYLLCPEEIPTAIRPRKIKESVFFSLAGAWAWPRAVRVRCFWSPPERSRPLLFFSFLFPTSTRTEYLSFFPLRWLANGETHGRFRTHAPDGRGVMCFLARTRKARWETTNCPGSITSP